MDHQTSPGSPWKNWAVNAVNTSLPPFPPASTVSAPSCPSLAFKPTENGDVPPGPSTPSSFLPEGHSSKDSTSPEQYLLHHPPISTPVDRPTMSDVAEHNYTTSTQMHGQVVQAPQHSQTLEGNTGVDSKGEAVAPPATSEVDQQSDRSASRTSSQASTSAQSTASKSPEEQLFTTTGRPARRATASKSVTYAPEYDKHGNPINKTKKAKTEKTKGNSRASTDIGEPSISRKSSTSQSTAASASTTRSGRAVTKPRDRHRSSDRDAKASMRERAKQKAQAVHDSDDERDSDGQSQEARPSGEEVKGSVEMGAEAQGREGRRSDDDASTEGKDKSQNTEDDEDEIDFLRKESNEADTIADDHTSARVERRRSRVNVEVFVSPSSDDKRRKNTDSAQQNAAKSPKRPRVQSPPEEDTKEAEHIQARDNDDEDKENQTNTANSASASRRETAQPQTPLSDSIKSRRDGSRDARSETPDSLRKSFAGKALNSLLGQAGHRRPGLTRRSFVPPLHPNRKPAPPPRPAPPMSRKDREALKKEREARGEDGSDEGSDSDEGKPAYNPFEEEIEGY